MSQRVPTLLALAAATAVSIGGVAAACPESFFAADEAKPAISIEHPRVRELPAPLLERLGLFALAPFLTGYGVTSILCRRRRRRRG